jgi:hypothetical protein
MAKKSDVQKKFEEIEEAVEQMKKDEYLKECNDLYQEIISKSNSEDIKNFAFTLESILNKTDENVLEQKKSVEDTVTKESIKTPEQEKQEFTKEIYHSLANEGKKYPEIKKIASEQYSFDTSSGSDNLLQLRSWSGGFARAHPELKKESKEQVNPYELIPEIKEFYDEKGINLTKVDGLFINTLLNLNKNEKSSGLADLTKALHKADPKRYPDAEHNTKRRVSVHLAGIKRDKELVENIDMNWTLAHYKELMFYLSPVPNEQIKKIYCGEATWSDMAKSIDEGATKQDVREIYVLAGREKEFRSASNRYTREDSKYKRQVEADNGKPIEVTKNNGRRVKIRIDSRGNTYKTNLYEHLDDLKDKE